MQNNVGSSGHALDTQTGCFTSLNCRSHLITLVTKVVYFMNIRSLICFAVKYNTDFQNTAKY